MIYTLTLNPAVDLMVEMKDFVQGRTNVSESEYKLPGGKGINVSQVLKNLGSDSIALGFVGGFTGRYIVEELEKKGLKTEFIEIDGDTRINIKLKDGNIESEINGNSPDIEDESLKILMDRIKELDSNDVFVMSGSVPKSLESDIYKKIMKNLKGGVRVILDTKGEALEEALEAKPFVVKPNHHELEELFGVEIDGVEEIIKYAKKVKDMGSENVIISMAGDGALLLTMDKVYISNVPKGQVKNSVGAGDSLVGGFTSAIANGLDILEAFKVGIASGSASAFSYELCTKKEMENLLKEIVVKEYQG